LSQAETVVAPKFSWTIQLKVALMLKRMKAAFGYRGHNPKGRTGREQRRASGDYRTAMRRAVDDAAAAQEQAIAARPEQEASVASAASRMPLPIQL
jgi:hypothetical protein